MPAPFTTWDEGVIEDEVTSQESACVAEVVAFGVIGGGEPSASAITSLYEMFGWELGSVSSSLPRGDINRFNQEQGLHGKP